MMTMGTYLKKACKVVLSFYVFSVFLSNPSLLSSFFSRIDDKNCVFLLCNAILVILARSSSTSSEPVQIRVPDQVTPNYGVQELKEEGDSPLVLDTQELIKDVVVVEEGYAAAGNDGSMAKEEDEEIESEEEGEGCYGEYEEESMDMYGGEEEKEESKLGMMSIEELNLKFEEFIWKMKEDIRIEAQQQLLSYI